MIRDSIRVNYIATLFNVVGEPRSRDHGPEAGERPRPQEGPERALDAGVPGTRSRPPGPLEPDPATYRGRTLGLPTLGPLNWIRPGSRPGIPPCVLHSCRDG